MTSSGFFSRPAPKTNTTALMGVMAGAGIMGMIAGFLFAPKSGKDLRQSLKTRAKENRARVNLEMEEKRSKFLDKTDSMQQKIAEATEMGKDKMNKLADKAEESAQEEQTPTRRSM